MNVQIEAPFKLSENLEQLINEKVDKLLTFYDRVTTTRVYLKDQEKRHQKAMGKTVEMQMEVPGQTLFAEAESDSYERALADASDKMKRQIRKFKDQMVDYK